MCQSISENDKYVNVCFIVRDDRVFKESITTELVKIFTFEIKIPLIKDRIFHNIKKLILTWIDAFVDVVL